MKIVLVVGARPNFMKIAPLLSAIREYNQSHQDMLQALLIHTGQHYDYEMSRVFFEDLALPEPDIYLNIGSGTHAEQTGKVMVEFEKVLLKEKPEMVVVVGDVNSTLAAALAAVKLHVPVAHVEAGLRSYDKSMPEEINRVLTDQIADLLFTPSPDADENLRKEGIPTTRIHFVGNVMVDALLSHLDNAKQRPLLTRLRLKAGTYALLTLHRPANVDDPARFTKLAKSLLEVASRIPMVFPVHPRTRKSIANFKLESYFDGNTNIRLIEPLGYLDFINLMMNAKLVLTDSGGVQEEATVLDIPCLTLRDTTEWQVTVTEGTNTIIGESNRSLVEAVLQVLNGAGKTGVLPKLWDGKAAERIVAVLTQEN